MDNQSVFRKFKKFKAPRLTKRQAEGLCFPKKKWPKKSFAPLPQQAFLSSFFAPGSPSAARGILLFHKVGSGKTCSSILVAKAWQEKVDQVLVAVPASLVSNYEDELASACGDRVDRGRLRVLSHHAFVAGLPRLSLQKTLLVVDEVQNIVSQGGSFYEKVRRKLDRAPPSLRVVLLTATPIFDHPSELALTMNLLPLPVKVPTGPDFDEAFLSPDGASLVNRQELARYLQGYVSFFPGMDERTFPSFTLHLLRCPMRGRQLAEYKRVWVQEKGSSRVVPQNNFYIRSRSVSNSLELPAAAITRDLGAFSCKIEQLVGRVLRCSGKVFVYSNFLARGVSKVVRVLDHLGVPAFPAKKKCYAVWSGKETKARRDAIRAAFNDPRSSLRILLGSPSMKEGVTLKRVRQVHVLEPYWNWARMEQVVGRAVRYCSHADLPPEKRSVRVYIYLATRPDGDLSVDEYIMRLANTKRKLVSQFEEVLRQVSVDCLLFNPSEKCLSVPAG